MKKNAPHTNISSKVDRPLLAYFAEETDETVVEGEYDDAADVWVNGGVPSVRLENSGISTMTFTKVLSEGNDRD